jgi:hypothetical protein
MCVGEMAEKGAVIAIRDAHMEKKKRKKCLHKHFTDSCPSGPCKPSSISFSGIVEAVPRR